MKKYLSMLLVLTMLVTLFAGCAPGEDTPTNTADTDITATPAPDNSAPDSSAPVQEDSPYNFAAGNFPKDERGIATEHYTYELPLTTTDEVLTVWMNLYSPQYVPAEGYQAMALPAKDRELTGVNIEYTLVTTDSRRTNFSVLRAADDFNDIMCYAANLYGGAETDIITEGYFVNLYDYRDYCPNYMYLVANHDPSDVDTYDKVFLAEDMVASMYIIYANPVINGAHFVRGDWMDEMGVDASDIVTWDDLYELLVRVKAEYETCEYPFGLTNTIDMLNCYDFTSYDNLSYLAADYLGPYYLVDGKATFAHINETDRSFVKELHRFMDAGLISPNWTAHTGGSSYRTMADNGETFYYFMTCADSQSSRFTNVDADCYWQLLGNPLRTEDQQLKVATKLSRTLGTCYNIASTCENIELAVTWCDWCFSLEGGELWSYGLEGECWEYDENGNRVASELILNEPNGLSVTWAINFYAGYTGGTAFLFYNRRNFMDPTTGADAWDVAMDILAWNQEHYDGSGTFPAGARLSDDDQELVNSLSGDVATYIAENYMLFVNQDLDIDSAWGEYIDGLYDIGMQDILDAYQRAYDAYIA